MSKTYRVTGKRWPITATSLYEDKIKAFGEFTLTKNDEWDLFATRYLNQTVSGSPIRQDSLENQLCYAYHTFDRNSIESTQQRKAGYWITYAKRHGVIEEVA